MHPHVHVRFAKFVTRTCTFAQKINDKFDIAIKVGYIHVSVIAMFLKNLEKLCDNLQPYGGTAVRRNGGHTSSVGRFSENVDDKVVTYLIFFV